LEGHGKTPGNAVKEAASIAEIGAPAKLKSGLGIRAWNGCAARGNPA
jgi:hypothetical protein